MSVELQTAIDNLTAKGTILKGIVDQAEAALIAVPQRIADAVAQAQAAGATPEQLQALNDLATLYGSEAGELSAAIAATGAGAVDPPADNGPEA